MIRVRLAAGLLTLTQATVVRSHDPEPPLTFQTNAGIRISHDHRANQKSQTAIYYREPHTAVPAVKDALSA